MGKIIGIDLGTTNSVVAVMEGGQPTVITTAEGGRLCPSVVAFTKNNERMVGQTAKRQAVINSENTISSIKRFMGRRFEEVEAERKMVPFEVVAGPSDEARVKIPITNREYSPQEISAMILAKLKGDAEAYLGQPVTEAVITVPAYFNDSQRQATKDAGKIAGLEVLRIINEPTAAALAYGLDKKKEETVAVYDLGGGTFDISILELGEGTFQVKSTAGDTHLGGDDWDQRVIDWMADDFKAKTGIDLRNDKMALQRLKEAAEKAKMELSTTTTTNINLPFITATAEGPQHLDMTLSRADFNKMTADLVDKCVGPFKQAISDSGLDVKDIQHVIMVGGATRMPAIQDKVRELTGGKEPHKGVNPDEVVAVGAAIQAGVLKGEVKDVLLLDVTPLSLGIETLGGVFTKLIERNTTIPTRKSEVFTTAADGQTSVEVHVLQGEREMADFNKTLGKFHLVGIPPAPRGIPQVEVTFDIDANGIVNVSAKDRATGNEQKITITASSGLDEDEIKKMTSDAEDHADEDRRQREEAETRNKADEVVYTTEKSLRELGDKVDADERSGIEAAIAEVKEALKGSDVSRIKTSVESLIQASHKLAEAVYAQASAGASGPGYEPSGSDFGPGEDEVIEADYEVVDEDKS